jgi:hypothetical protein
MKYSIKKDLAKLTPKKFESWFKARKFDGDWEAEFKKIGGKLSEPKKTGTKSRED